MRRPAIFLDRDGVLTKENFVITRPAEVEVFEYAKDCVNKIHEMGYLAIVVTNQSGIARGIFSEDDLISSNEWLMSMTGVDEVFYCPHHPKGDIGLYSKICDCRKPGTGLIRQAVVKFDIDIDKSFMVGDRASDILMGRKARVKTVLVESGYGRLRLEEGVEADFYCEDLKEFVIRVLNKYQAK